MIVEMEAPLRFAPPRLKVPRLTGFTLSDAMAAYRQLEGAETVELRQGWYRETEPFFRPGRVRTGWTRTTLIVAAELDDADIFNPVAAFNDPAFMKGDVFEIFLRPENQEAYYEFHVSPQNQQFQLRIPSGVAFQLARAGGSMEHWKIRQRCIESRATIRAAEQKWWVAAVIPFSLVAERGPVTAGSSWRFSFCRYDYTRGSPWPILSSTSPHRQADFHRQAEWGTLLFAD
jgi:hypothetical protein